ncbi:MAG TPA: ABC transporter ATP-binding protein [Syntrophorhabdales bacterium]|nr:ABC transporter ATP-binding protein [Syntrophorhabdales bacterium]
MGGEYVIETEGLTKTYGSQVAVNNLTMTIKEGEIFGFLGPNGAGKTTTILMLLGLTEPTSGKARVCGFDPKRDPIRVKERVGYLPENVGFYDDMNAKENLRFVARLNRIPDRVSAPKIDALLATVGLEDEAAKKVRAFSKGMRQRLGIAEVLVKEPKIVFLDEPTVGLDPDGTNRMLEMIHSLSRDKGITVFLSSHLLDQVQRISDRVGIMIKGNLVAAGRMDELAREKLGVETAEFTLEEIYMKYFKEA